MASRMCLLWCLLWAVVSMEMTSLKESSHHKVCGWSGSITSSKKKKLRIEETSANVFVDRNNNNINNNSISSGSSRSLETVYYVTDVKQQTDFFWSRESGVRINIGLQDIQLMSTFEDVDHTRSDNEFLRGSPSFIHRKDYYTRIWRNFCRHPIPAGYSLTLELSLDRTTKASEEKCTEDMWLKGLCPPESRVGETFVRRTLNDPCVHVGSYPEPLNAAPNSLVCLEDTDLLSHVFNITLTSERKITKTSKRCQLAAEGCETCQSSTTCLNISEKYCCKIECLSRKSCRESLSCSSGPAICSMGDAYRLTMVPMASQNLLDFKCHLRRLRPALLYRYWFYVSIPQLNFETPKFFQVLPTEHLNIDSGVHVSHFFHVEHNSGVAGVSDDVIFQHRETNKSTSFTIHPLNKQQQSNWKFLSHPMSNNIKVTHVQFSHPFAYSTSNWNQTCWKNLSLFQPSPPGKQSPPHGVKVDVKIEKSPGLKSAFRYHVKSLHHRPYVKILIPGNQSVLRWWFSLNNISFDSNLVEATFRADEKTWQVNIAGKLLTCPNYMNIICVDVEDEEKLFDFDVVVVCPSPFHVTISLPVSQTKSWTGKILKLTAESSTGSTQFLKYLTFLPFVKTTFFSVKSQMLASRTSEGHDETAEELSFKINTKLLLLFSMISVFLLNSAYVSVSIVSKKMGRFEKMSTNELTSTAGNKENKAKHRLSLFVFFLQLLHGILFTFSGFMFVILCNVSSPSQFHQSFQLYTCSHLLQCSPHTHRQHLTQLRMEQQLMQLNSSLRSCERYIEGFLSMVKEHHHLLLLNLEKKKTFRVEPTWKFTSTSLGLGSWIVDGKNKSHRDDCSSEWMLIPDNSNNNIPDNSNSNSNIPDNSNSNNNIPDNSNNNNNNNNNIPDSNGNNKCFFSFRLTTWQKTTEVEKCLGRRMDFLLQVHGFPTRHDEHNLPNSCLVRTTTTTSTKSRPSMRFFSVARERRRSSQLLSDDDNDGGGDDNDGDDDDNDGDDAGEGSESNESTPHQDAFNLVLWHRIFTFFDLVLLLKRVSSTYHVYKTFFMKSKVAKLRTFSHKYSTTERSSDHQVEACPPGLVVGTFGVYSGENIIQSNDIGILEEKAVDPVKTILAAATLAYLTLGWALLRNGDSLLMMILRSHMDSSSKDTAFDVLLEHDFLRSYHRLTVFDLSQAVDSLAFLHNMKNGLISLKDRSLLKKLHEHQVNTTHECLFNSCGGHYRQTNETMPSLARVDPSEASFVEVISSVIMTTASFVVAEVLAGSILSSFMLYCCPKHANHYTDVDPRSFRTRPTTDRKQTAALTDHKLLETHV